VDGKSNIKIKQGCDCNAQLTNLKKTIMKNLVKFIDFISNLLLNNQKTEKSVIEIFFTAPTVICDIYDYISKSLFGDQKNVTQKHF
jgi:hypothetical protein